MIDTQSDTWRQVAKTAGARIAEAHMILEEPTLTETETAIQRGRIVALREILALADPPPPPVRSFTDED